jgi:hypothetical protein
MLKRVIRGGVRRAKRWLEDDDQQSEQPAWLSNYAYGGLNSVLNDLLKSGDHVYPQYAYGLLHGAYLARNLRINRISTLEFGVAGGNGLLSLEEIAAAIERLFDIEIDVYGFDTGRGLPKPQDYRDLPNLYRESAFAMDEGRLRRCLKKATLVLGPVAETVDEFLRSLSAPLAFISFDLDYYSATMSAFKVLSAGTPALLPRVHCYFDDIVGFTHSEFTGERLAIAEFNRCHPIRKISPIFGLRHFLPFSCSTAIWPEQIFMAHIFDHELYSEYDGLDVGFQLSLSEKK